MTAFPPPLRSLAIHLLALALGAAAALGTAFWAKEQVETITLTDVRLVLARSGHDWTEATVDGLSVTLSGTAPDEATRFAALSAAGSVVDASRIIDDMGVAAAATIPPPDFSIEILKNDGELSLIGLVPVESDPDTIIERARRVAGTAQITDLLESADFPPPPGWERALSFGIGILDDLPPAKVSISPTRVRVRAVADSPEAKRELERQLDRDAPAGVALALEISAPRPVITPFTLRFVIDDQGARFDACSADTEAARDAILAAAIAAGATGELDCTLGLGTPSTKWGAAAARGIEHLAAIGRGTLTISNADVSLRAAEGTDPDLFEREAGELEGSLPPAFSLNAMLPEEPETQDEAEPDMPEFVATRSPEGLLQLRGRLGDELTRAAVESFAAARFGAAQIYPATLLDDDLPAGWSVRVLAALEALAVLNNGMVMVTPDMIDVTGVAGRKDAKAEVSRILSSKLEDGSEFLLDITYSEALDPLAALPTPEECIASINAAAEERKITFEPSSTDIESDAMKTIDAIADILRDCRDVPIEIGGHTDSQGRESMNQRLSQARADAVLNALMARRVLTSNLTAVGYGESQPIADNDTEQGREANRRIEFRLVGDAAPEADDTADETAGTEEGSTE